MEKNYLVTKSNYFIMNSSYDLRLEEQKIILTLASMVQPDDEEFKPYKFKISEFMDLIGVEDKSKYTEIPKITKELMKKVFEIKEGNKLIQTAWLAGAIHEKGKGYVELIFSPYLKPYMLKLNSMFTQYKLSNILNMKSKYSPRIYEILKCNEFKKQGYIEISIDDLRKLLKSDDIYPLYADFKRKIILQSQKELKKLCDIAFEFEEIKTGRRVTSLKLYIVKNIAEDPKRSINESRKTYKSAKSTENPATINNIAMEEVAAGRIISENNSKIYSDEAAYRTKSIIKNITGKDVSLRTCKEIYKNAVCHKKFGNEPFNLIREVAEYSKTQDVQAIVGWFKTTIREYERPIRSIKYNKFNDYDQRQYDYDELERKLLGWDD